METALVFIIVLGVLIFVHEAGHFFAARAAGIKVEEFAFGFPPRIFSWKRGETTYAINLFPLGGYVRLLGEDGTSKDDRAFGNQSVWRRLGVILAGVVMNLLLAIVTLWVGFMIGMVPIVSSPDQLGGTHTVQILITEVRVDSAADQAGITSGDVIDGFATPQALQDYTRAHAGETVSLNLVRGNKTLKKDVKLGTDSSAPLGVALYEITKVKLGPIGALRAGVIETGKTIVATFTLLGSFFRDLFHKGINGTEGVSGPVGIYKVTGQAVHLGFTYVLQLVASLSINLALLNVLPIPALDGGRGLFVALEAIVRRKVVRQEIETIIHAIGFLFLILLVGLITYKDLFGH